MIMSTLLLSCGKKKNKKTFLYVEIFQKEKFKVQNEFKVTPNLRRCPSEKNSYARRLQGNLHKLYIKRKVIKCTIQ